MMLLNVDSKKELEEIIEQALLRILNDKLSSNERPDPLLNRVEAAEYLHISLGTLHTHTKSGKIQGQRIGCRLLYRKSDLDKSTIVTKKQI